MLNTKKKTVREVLASFDKMINELDAIVTDCDKGIERRQLEIQQAQEEIKAMEREASDAKASRAKLAAIVQSVEVPDQTAEAHPRDKVELA